MAAFAFNQDLGLARVVFTCSGWVADLAAFVSAVFAVLVAFLLAAYLAGIFAVSWMALDLADMPTSEGFLASVHAEGRLPTSCLNHLVATSAFYKHLLFAPTWPVMASLFALMPTFHFELTKIAAFWSESSTYNWRSHRCLTTWAGLGLRVDHWAFLAQTRMTRHITGMFFTVENLLASKFAGVISRDGRTFELAAGHIAGMDPTDSFLLADSLAVEGELIGCSLPTLDLSDSCEASAALLDSYLALRASSLMTSQRAFMTAMEFLFAGHPTTWNGIFTGFPH